MARRIRLTEDGLRRMIGVCVGEMVNEGLFDRITAELKSADEAENPCYLGDEDMPDFKGGLKRAWNGAKDFVKRGYKRMSDDLQAAAEVENPLYCDEGLLRLRGTIHEAVKRALNEGGHLYWRDEEGIAHSNSKDLYRGVPGAILVSHGEWSDPEILYKGKEINYYDIEDGLWAAYNDFMKYESEEEKAEFSNDMGVEAVPDNDEVYEKYIEWRGGVEYVQEELDNCVWAMNGCP